MIREHAQKLRIDFNAIAAGAAFIAAGTSLGALWYMSKQIEISNSGVAAQVSQAIGQELVEINKSFLDHPELWKYFYQGQPIQPEDSNFPRVMALADMHLDFFDGFDDEHVRKIAGMEEGGKYWVLWAKYFEDLFRTAPALCLRLSQTKVWYTETITALWDAHCANATHWRLPAGNPPSNMDLKPKTISTSQLST